MQFLNKTTINTIFTLFVTIILFTPSITQAQTLTDSPPITATRNGQVIENVRIVANGEPAIRVSGFSGVVIRNVEIWHQGGHGINCANAPDLTITNVSITHIGTASPNTTSEQNNINCENADRMTINQVRLEGGSSGVYVLTSNNVTIQFLEGYNFRGPAPRGQLVQFNQSDNCLLEDFSAINNLDNSISRPEDNVSIFLSNNCIVRRGLVDGNNSNSGVGIMFELSNDGLAEDIDTIRQGNGSFAAFPGNNVIFRRTRAKDNWCGDQGLGAPLSNSIMWAASGVGGSVSGLRIENSTYYNSCQPFAIVWDASLFDVIELVEQNFVLRNPIVNQFPWEVAVSANFTSSSSGLTVNFTDTSSSNTATIVNWFWDFGDGRVSTTANPSHTYSTGGTYTVNLTVTDSDGASNSVSRSVTALGPNQAPNASFTSSISGLTANFTDSSTDSDGTIASRSWNFGDGGTSSALNPSHTYSSAGTYTVSLTVTDNDGFSDSFSQSVTVSISNPNQAPNAGFTSSTSDLTTNFNDTSTDSDGTIVSRFWNFGDGGTSSAQNPSHTYSSSGIYTVNLTVTDNDGASDSFSRSVTVIDPNQAPNAGFTSNTSGLTISFSNTSTDNDGTIVSQLWNFGDGVTSTSINPSHTYSSAGPYTVRLTVTDNDGATDTVSQSFTITNPNAAPKVSYLYCFLYGCK